MDYERKITTNWVGGVIRKRLGLRAQRGRDGYVVQLANKAEIEPLYQRYGVGVEPGEEGAEETAQEG